MINILLKKDLQYCFFSEFYEELIKRKPDISSNYCFLGLAYLLEGREEDAQLTWLVVLSQSESSDELYDILSCEISRQLFILKPKNAWLIRIYLREIRPNDINNLLYLIYLEINLNIFTFQHLTNWNLLEVLESSPKEDIYTSLLLETFSQLKKLNLAEVTDYLSHCEAKFASLGIDTSEALIIKKLESQREEQP